MEAGFLTEPGAHLFGRPVAIEPRDLCPPRAGLQMHTAAPGFYVGSGGWNTGPHA